MDNSCWSVGSEEYGASAGSQVLAIYRTPHISGLIRDYGVRLGPVRPRKAHSARSGLSSLRSAQRGVVVQ